MALFGGSRDISLFNTVSKELINDIIQLEVGYYKFALEKTTSNVYGESMGKMFYEPVRIACLMKKEDQSWSSDDFGSDVNQTIDFRFLKEELKGINLVPEVGDILLFKNNFYEVDEKVENPKQTMNNIGETNDMRVVNLDVCHKESLFWLLTSSSVLFVHIHIAMLHQSHP